MKSIIENLNEWGGNLLQFVWPMLWQSSLLIAFVFMLDLLLARRIRASVRYALWLAVLVKLLLPPTLALPTGAAWWLFQAKPSPALVTQHYAVTYSDAPAEPFVESPSMPMPVPPPPKLSAPGWAMLATGVVSAGLLLWLGIRWWQVTRTVRRAMATDEFSPMLAEASRLAGKRVFVRLKIVEGTMSPAVCGLFRPVILLPRALAERLSPAQLRVVLLHELFHLRRGDVWVNCAQALLQIVYWWHPLLWVANARIRRVREEAVDDAVMLALREEADGYAPTLLEVAKLAFRRPLLSLGLVGIMESRSALRQRIERLVDFRAPRRAGLTLASLCGVFVFSAVALPMGESPAPAPVEQQPAQELVATNQHPEDEVLVTLRVDPDIFIKNIKAQAAKSMISPTNDCGIILLDILRSEGVNTVPPHGIAFNTRDGEITVQNTAAQLDIVRQVVEQLNRADGKCELPLRHSSFRRPAVLIEASIYELSAAESEKIVSGLASSPFDRGGNACWTASLEQFKRLTNQMAASGYKPTQRPRLQTSSGMPAQFFVGTDMYGTEFDCKPFVDQGAIDLLLQGRVESDPAAGPAITNRFNTRAAVENHGGVVVRMENAGGHTESNLVICIGVQILTNQPGHYQQRLQAIINRADGTKTEIRGDGGAKLLPPEDSPLYTRIFKIDTNAFLENLHVKVPSFDWSGTTNLFRATSLAARFVITNAGVDLNSPPGKALFFNEHDSLLFVKATEADLQVITPLITNLSPTPAGSFRERLQTIINRGNGTNDDPVDGLFTRIYKADIQAFISTLNKKGANLSEKSSSAKEISAAARKYFGDLGVDWDSPAGKAIYFNDHNDLLLVRATKSDLDGIDKALQAINAWVPQLHIKARFYEVPEKMAGELVHLPGLTNDLTVAGATAVLSEENLPVFLKAIRSIHGVETLAEPECTTLSGRQAKIMSTQQISIVTNMNFRELSTQKVSTNYVGNGKSVLTTNIMRVGEVSPKTGKLEYGPVLDIVPYVLSDGERLNLAMTAMDSKFLGYLEAHKNMFGHVESGWPAHHATNSAGEKITLPQFFPLVQSSQTFTTATMNDGQTLVLFPAASPVASLNQDKEWESFLAGRALEMAAKKKGGKLIVLVTADIVDQAGNRVRADAR